jgi:leader peptidase (prepilin peptidase)/N-methyltransferase
MTGTVLTVFSAVLGAIIGSFLNACIHRMPRGISLNNPRRSFCPSCQRLIPWYENLPLLSWLALRGKCSGCGARISVRYFLVELLTAGVFLAIWRWYGLPLAPVYWIFAALLIAATFIDIEHFIIPDEITWGGTVAGLALSPVVPAMMQTASRLEAFGLSLAGAALGYGLLWLIVEGGKLAFGKKRHVFGEPEPFFIRQEGEQIILGVGEDRLPWEEIFYRLKSDILVLDCAAGKVGEREVTDTIVKFYHDRAVIGSEEIPIEQIDSVSGTLRAITVPREAMGFGDVKFIACIGAFLGWKAVLFTICAASIIGCVAALAGLFIARDKAGSRVPFGPFLALGGAIWIFGGERLWDWYFGILRYGEGGIGF